MLPSADSSRASTSDLRFAEIARRLESQDKVLERVANGISGIQTALSDLIVANALSTQDRANTRETLVILKDQQGMTQKKLDTLAGDLAHQGETLDDHETRIRDFEKLSTRIAVAVILAVILPIALFALQRMFP
jgi:chromosome segregation ATPase